MKSTEMGIGLNDLPAGAPKYEPAPPEPCNQEELEQMIVEMRSHLQQGFGLLESVWARCLANRELAASIEDKDQFQELQKVAQKVGEIGADIYEIATTGDSFVDRFQGQAHTAPVIEASDNPSTETKECFGDHPGGFEAKCLLCPDERNCDTAAGTHSFDQEYGEHEDDLDGKRYKFNCPHCGGDLISEELKAYSRVCCNLAGEFDPLDPGFYQMEFAEPLDDPWHGASYWCGKCGKNILNGATRNDLREWLLANNMNVKEPGHDGTRTNDLD
jgi:hypothetical protein